MALSPEEADIVVKPLAVVLTVDENRGLQQTERRGPTAGWKDETPERGGGQFRGRAKSKSCPLI